MAHITMPLTRSTLRRVAGLLAVASACAIAGTGPDPAPATPATPVGSAHDFDFEHGHWRTALRRRLHPLSGSEVWAEYSGTSVVHPVLGGRANLVELDVSGAEGRIQALSLRLFEPKRERWTLNFANAASGMLATPMTGGFGGGARGVFYSAEEFDGRPILVRFVIEATGKDACRFEQAFSADGGKTWEINWIAVDTRS